MHAPEFRLGDTLPITLRAGPRGAVRRVYTVHVMRVQRYHDGVRFLLCRPNGCCVFVWDGQLATLLRRGVDWEPAPQPPREAPTDRPG